MTRADVLVAAAELAVRHGEVPALGGVDLVVRPGESVAVVGESGAGKSTLARAVIGLSGGTVTGSLRIAGTDVAAASEQELRDLRATRVGFLGQGQTVNPTQRLGDHVTEVIRQRAGRRTAREQLPALFDRVGLPLDIADRYPHQVSGGQLRRVGLAAALAQSPDLLILDEPTAGLDPVSAAEVVDSISASVAAGAGLLVITHALADAVRLAERVLVLYRGRVMEDGPTDEVLARPRHPYTRDLVVAYPVMTTTRDLRPIRGRPAERAATDTGCRFADRCAQAIMTCHDHEPALQVVGPVQLACHLGGVRTVLRAERLTRVHGRSRTARPKVDRDDRPGVHDIDLRVQHGSALGVLGPSGSGKSTLAHLLAGLTAPQAGRIEVGGRDLAATARGERAVQLVQQNPWDALSPRWTIRQSLTEPLRLSGRAGDDEVLAAALADVGLPADVLDTRPDHLPGGALQRICLARALLARPEVLIADEPTSLLDASEQARVLVTLRERQSELGLALVFVTHDAAVARKITDEVVVLDRGRIVEHGRTEDVFGDPAHPTTRTLLAAAPHLL